ncbi:MAG: 50S ribosomal protein L29 [Deltaproteobacteria bacterium]|nr:50S ribosomal protein L29 [Deltaproteobacteria bacterium]MBI3391055.1 50S ribosomal protein L29 [Deltaproteobacteria bacterium]
MQASELRDLSDQELSAKVQELRESLFHLRLRRGTNRLESPAQIRKTRNDIARALTIQHERAKGIKR